MPATWLQYGVDALNAGYADPYNPVDAIFAAARYLRAAGAASEPHSAILAYNHSEEYAASVLLRAKLISTYPKSVIATLTGLIDARLPVTGKQFSWRAAPAPSPSTNSSATANAGRRAAARNDAAPRRRRPAATVGRQSDSQPRPPARRRARCPLRRPRQQRRTRPAAGTAASRLQLVELMSAPNASVVAVQDGRIAQARQLAHARQLRDPARHLRRRVHLRRARQHRPTYRLPKMPRRWRRSAASAELGHERRRRGLGSCGRRGQRSPARSPDSDAPVTLRVKRAHAQTTPSQDSVPAGSAERCRPPPARCACSPIPEPGRARGRRARRHGHAGRAAPGMACRCASARSSPRARCSAACSCRRGERRSPALRDPARRATAHDRPAADPRELGAAPCGAAPAGRQGADRSARARPRATCSCCQEPARARGPLRPRHHVYACGRQDVASGAIDRRVLAVLAFLSRSGLKPTVQRAALWTEPVHRRRAQLSRATATRRRGRRSRRQRRPDRRSPGRRHRSPT